MRQSRYTVVADGAAGEHLLYHTASGAFAVLDDRAFSDFEACSGQYAPELAEGGFLTELTPEEELQLQREQFDAVRADRTSLTLSIVPTYACNYRCPYCYEQGHNGVKGKMGESMMQVVCSFVAQRHEEVALSSLSVQWYGGDPSLALDVVEGLSRKLIGWCDERGIAYDAFMITNANLIDEDAAQLMADARISHVMLTIDGPEDVHNRRRVAADGSNSYEKNILAARYLRARGIQVAATMNVDKVTWPLFPTIREKLLVEEGIELNPAKLCDYGHFYGQQPFAAPDFDLFTHEDYAHEVFGYHASKGLTAGDLRNMLSPVGRFCTGQLDNYFVIDLLGDVYSCDGWVGDKGYVRFNLHDDPSTWKLSDVSHDATRDEKCSACELLPICQGSCYWERACNGWPCHPFKYTLPGYLRLYRDCFDARGEGVVRLA